MKLLYFLIALFLLGLVIYFFTARPTVAPVADFKNPYSNLIRINQPLPHALVTSPLIVEGEARGQWYFEASFPVKLMDGNNKELASAPAQAQGEWMTGDFVPFKVVLNFTKPETQCGTLILAKDNPSGLSVNDASVHLPVCF